MKIIKPLFYLASLIVFLLVSCGNPCNDVVCQNAGICDNGICECAEGYNGSNCEKEIRAIYLGAWSGEWICTPNDEIESDSIFITRDSENSIGLIIEIDGVFINATINAVGLVGIPIQSHVVDSNNITIEGAGGFTATTGSIAIKIIDEAEMEEVDCDFTLDR